MQKNLQHFISYFLLTILGFSFSNAQPWTKNLREGEINFYKIQEEFKNYWKGKTPGRSVGWKQFKRWEWFWEQRVFPMGNLPASDILRTRMEEYYRNFPHQKNVNANWTLIGPSVIPANEGGVGRINCVTIHPTNTNILWIGSASGGLWKSTDGGTSWSTNTDNFGSLGITSIMYDPTNSNTMYIATGDGDAGDTYSIGVLKSTDGGSTWNTTGLNWTASQTRTISKLVSHPTDGNIILAATSDGIYRTTNAGTTWTNIISGTFKDLEVNLSDATIWYAARNSYGVYKSTTTGLTFSQLTTGLPTSGYGRVAVSVANSSPSTIYALYVNSTSGFYGLYKTTDAGTNWTQQSTTPNILSWDGTGTDGQGWYDLVLDTDPTNATVVYVGGVNMYKSASSGTSWTKISHWYSGTGIPYVHADQHGFAFLPGNNNTIFSGNDGGIFKSTNGGTAWTDLSSGLSITQFYKLGASATNANRIYAGAQDNGTDRYLSGAWRRIIGGDGMEALIDYSNENVGYGELYYGDIRRTTNGGTSFTSISSGIGENGGWVTPYIINPVNPYSLYLGTTKVYKTTNRGDSWTAISSSLTGSTLIALAIAPTDTNTIYAATSSSLYKTTNNGGNWTSISSGLPGASLTYLAVHPTSSSTVFVTFSGYGSSKVYKTTNGGTSWTNISTGLPSIPTNCIAVHPQNGSELFVGTDVGAYHSSNGGTTWESFSTGLPNVIVNELEIHLATSKLRAATYGRGLWETSISINSTSIAGIKFNDTNGNGVKDAGENGLANWKIKISGPVADSLLTSGTGEYYFGNLTAGNYTVSEVQQNGWTQTAPASGTHSVSLSNGQSVTGKDFGNRPLGMFSGMKFKDVNGNGSKDAGEPGLPNWKIKIAGPYSDSILTDASGNYSFIITQNGTFTVSEVQQYGWVQTYPVSGTHSLSFSGGNTYSNIDFGNKVVPQSSLTAVNFEDGLVPPTNWTLNNPNDDVTWQIFSVSSYGIGAKSAKYDFYSNANTGTTDELVTPVVNGFLATDSLLFDYAYAEYNATYIDSFRVQMSLDGGTTFPVSLFYAWGSTLSTAPATTSQFTPTSSQWKTARILLGAQVVGANVVLKFKTVNGYGNNFYLDSVRIKTTGMATGNISGTKFLDANGNAVKDANETGLANWKIKISGAKSDSVLTDASGNYLFSNIPIGNYTVSEVQQNGWQQTLPVNNSSYSVTVTTGQTVSGKNFGNFQLGTISGTKFNDVNANGVKDAGEVGLQNWKIKISGGKNDSILTDANGNFSFSNLFLGNYTIAEVQQNGWIQSLPVNSGNYSVSITTSGSTLAQRNFGNYQPASISGMKFNDMNGNGNKDAGETGIANWRIKIAGTKNDSTLTDANGNYTLNNVIAGTYTLSEIQQNGWMQTMPASLGNYSVTLAAGQNVSAKDFGNFQLGSISGNVFHDRNGNTIADMGEEGLTNWKIKLSGTKIDSTLTDASGNFSFSNLPLGNYTLTQAVQSGWKQTLPLNSGTYSVSIYQSGMNVTGKNFGNFQCGIVSGNVFEDSNGDTVLNNEESGFSSAKVFVKRANENVPLDSVVTDENGNFSFAQLLYGSYSVYARATQANVTRQSQNTVALQIASGTISSNNTLAMFFPAWVNGIKFHDLNANATYDAGESGIFDATIYLNGTKNDSTTTDESGIYSFTNLFAGTYSLSTTVSLENGIASVVPNGFVAVSGLQLSEQHFGEYTTANVRIEKFSDDDGDTLSTDDVNGKKWALSFYSGTNADSLMEATNDSVLQISNVKPGNYSVLEADSSLWENIVVRVYNHTLAQARIPFVAQTGAKLSVKSGDNVRVQFVNHYLDSSRYRTFTVSTAFAAKSKAITPKNPIPTLANVRDTVVKKLGGMILGLAQTNKDSAKRYGWITWKKGSDVALFFTAAHTLPAKPFDSIRVVGKKAKVFVKGLKATRKTYDNKLAEQVAMFKLNIFASSFVVTPDGFQNLLYKKSNSVFNNMAMLDIADSVDYILTRWKYIENNFDYNALLNTLTELNSSFATSFADTDIISTSPLQLDGDKLLRTVNYLRKGTSSRTISSLSFANRSRDHQPETFSLAQNYPNPFNPATTIHFTLSSTARVSMNVFDILGKNVATLFNDDEMEEGEYEIHFDATHLPSGVYFYRLNVTQNGNVRYTDTKKLLLLK
jgi:photosystem II stability/assembly factor-like uncharacterized protein/uncharacterized protein (DUF2141 family)